MQHDYHIATQAKFDALNTVIKQQTAQIEALKTLLSDSLKLIQALSA